MERDVVDLEELVSELLVLANLREAPPYRPRECAAPSWWTRCCAARNDEMRATGRDVAIEAPRHVPESFSCDSKYLSRALVNVLRNAVRYAKSRVAAHGRARRRAHHDQRGRRRARAFRPTERERLFEPFTRLEGSRGRDSGGVGLGLAIVKSVAEWHGGEARISDSPLGGARVSISW